MGLRSKQSEFNRKASVLALVAYEMGYELTDGDAYRDPRADYPYGHPKSCHKIRLARDYNIFKNGKFLRGEEAKKAHNMLHDVWDKMGGAPRLKHDLNHYSFEHNGMR